MKTTPRHVFKSVFCTHQKASPLPTPILHSNCRNRLGNGCGVADDGRLLRFQRSAAGPVPVSVRAARGLSRLPAPGASERLCFLPSAHHAAGCHDGRRQSAWKAVFPRGNCFTPWPQTARRKQAADHCGGRTSVRVPDEQRSVTAPAVEIVWALRTCPPPCCDIRRKVAGASICEARRLESPKQWLNCAVDHARREAVFVIVWAALDKRVLCDVKLKVSVYTVFRTATLHRVRLWLKFLVTICGCSSISNVFVTPQSAGGPHIPARRQRSLS